MEKKILFREFLFMISIVPARNYLFKISNLRTRIRFKSCSILRLSVLTIFNINDANGVVLSVFIVNCKHISNFVLIVDFEQANICSVHIEKASIFEDKIEHIMCYALF